MSLAGVDVSSFQRLPRDWQAEAGAISWAAVKMTELSAAGPYENPDAAADWAWLKANGKGRVAYLFGHPSQGVTATVGLFASALGRVGLDDGDGICLDHEVSDGLGAAQVAAWGRAVLANLAHMYHRAPLLYTFLSFAGAGNCDGMGGYPLWIADPSSPAGHPRVPAPWKSWAIHQHAITGAIDRDTAVWQTLAGMRAALGAQGKATVRQHITAGEMSLARLAGTQTPPVHPATILRLTADHFPAGYPQDVADYINGVFAGTVLPSAKMPKGLVLYLPA
jgi:hypothetical protein